MNIDRESLMYYEALIAAFFTIAVGFLIDVGFKGTAFASAFIVIVSLIALLCTWLGPNPDINDRG